MWFFKPTGCPKRAWQVEQLKKARVLSLASAPVILVARAGAADESPDGVTSPSLCAGATDAAPFTGPVGIGCAAAGDVLGAVNGELCVASIPDSLLISFLPLAWLFLVSSDLAPAASLATGALRAATSSLVSRKCSCIPSVLE